MKKGFLGIIVAFLFGGCATILEEDTQTLNVRTSTNQEVEVVVAGRTYETPASVEVDRDGSELSVATKADGCAATTSVDREVDTTFFVNILTGGLWGSTTDYATGKMWEYDSDVVINCSE